MTYQQKTYTLLSTYLTSVVRMAERSKAPDSRLIIFPVHSGSGRSGLRKEAWVRIPLLTMSLFILLLLFFFFLQCVIYIFKISELI